MKSKLANNISFYGDGYTYVEKICCGKVGAPIKIPGIVIDCFICLVCKRVGFPWEDEFYRNAPLISK